MSRAHRGEALEERLAWTHASYRRLGMIVERTEPPTRAAYVGGRAVRLSIPGTAGVLDYLAASGGTVYRWDAKSVRGARWRFNLLEEEQAASLDAWAAQRNAEAALLIEADGAAWWCPWRPRSPLWPLADRWRAWWRSSERAASRAASLGPDDLRVCGEPAENLDWLAAAARVWVRDLRGVG